jgi:hypothetical protein
MSITILINESQKQRLLLETSGNEMDNVIKKNYQLVKKILSTSSKQLNTDLKFLITWGASIGGMVGPINDFVQGKYPELNDVQLSLLLTGVIATYYFDNKTLMDKLYKKLTEEGIFTQFLTVIKKCDELRDSFLTFIDSLGITLHKVTNMMSYTFIIPLLPLVYNMSMSGSVTEKEISEIVIRLSSFGLVAVSGVIMKELISKIVRRFRSK